MQAARNRHGLATAAGLLALIGGAAALTPASVAAATVHKCANQTLRFEEHQPESNITTHISELIDAIITEGISCASADQFLKAYVGRTTTATPGGFVCKPGKFKAPAGHAGVSCTKHGIKIQYAAPAG